MTFDRGPGNSHAAPGDAVDSELGAPESVSPAYGGGYSPVARASGSSGSTGSSGSMGSKSGSAGDKVSGAAQAAGDKLSEAAQNPTAQQATDAAQRVANRATDMIGKQVDAGAQTAFDRAGGMLDHVADAVEHAGSELRSEEPPVADAANAAARQLRSAADYLRGADMERVVNGAQDFARRQPGLFLGAALAVGLMASRFLKATPASQGGSDEWSDTQGERFLPGMNSGYQAYTGYRSTTGIGRSTSSGATTPGGTTSMGGSTPGGTGTMPGGPTSGGGLR